MLQRPPAELLSVLLLKLGENEMSKGHDKGQMSDREAMKMALEALETLPAGSSYKTHNAASALRQAIQEAALQKLSDGLMRWSEQAKKREQWTPDDMAYRPGGLSMEDEPDLSEQGRNRSAVLGNNIQAMVDAGLPFLDALETTLKVYDHPTKPQEDTAYRPGGLSMEQKPVAWWNPDESGLSFKQLRGDWQPLYAAPVHTIDINKKCVDETWKNKYEPVPCKHKRYSVDAYEQTGTCYDCGAQGRMRFVVYADASQQQEPNVYGDGNMYRGVRSKDSETKTLYCKAGECDWCMLEATQESLREHMEEVKRLRAELDSLKNQKPVAWMHVNGDYQEPSVFELKYEEWEKYPLYTAPPRKEWVGLTDAEAWEEWVKSVDSSTHSDRLLAFRYLRAIEAKLKEKNNG